MSGFPFRGNAISPEEVEVEAEVEGEVEVLYVWEVYQIRCILYREWLVRCPLRKCPS